MDVPGHEKFVKNMVAGATGIDIVAMVIAADEGVMPQTREHMEICTLLGIKHGFVVLTKIDMVDEEWLELALEDVRDFTAGTFLDEYPDRAGFRGQRTGSCRNSAVSWKTICAKVPERSKSSLFRLPVDRVFTMKGFGTVITGSLISGRVQVGDTIMIYPSLITSKVRGHSSPQPERQLAEAGQRTAINFQGLEKAAINRGEILALSGRPSNQATWSTCSCSIWPATRSRSKTAPGSDSTPEPARFWAIWSCSTAKSSRRETKAAVQLRFDAAGLPWSRTTALSSGAIRRFAPSAAG